MRRICHLLYIGVAMRRLGMLVLLVVASSVALAWQHKQLSGSYRIGGQTVYDPPENEPQNTHFYFELMGTAAKDLFEQMKAAPVSDVCADTGTKTKTIGEMRCTQSANGKQHRCWFGIDIKNQRITNGVVC